MNYRITNIDPDLWQNFKALVALEKRTIRGKLIEYITEQVVIFKVCKNAQGEFLEILKKGNKKV